MNELRKCPFCGGEAVVHVNNGVCVICRKCGSRSKTLVDGYVQGKPSGTAINSVVKAWNNRTLIDEVLGRLESKIRSLHNPNWNAAMEEAIEIIKEEFGGAMDENN